MLKDDVKLVIQYEGQKKIVVDTSYIELDIIRSMFGLKPDEQK